MISGGIKCEDQTIIIYGAKIGLLPQVLLLTLTAVGFFMPFIITTIVLQDGEGLRFGLILSWILFLGLVLGHLDYFFGMFLDKKNSISMRIKFISIPITSTLKIIRKCLIKVKLNLSQNQKVAGK